MNNKIYIIIPAYNVERTLKFCIDSIINQTYKNWEAIVVDDGSSDKTGQICDNFASKDTRIKVIHQKNKGNFGARNTAVESIKQVENTYCFFCDSDDALPSNAIEILLKVSEKYDCDIVAGSSSTFIKYRKPNLNSYNNEIYNLDIYSDDEIIKKIYPCCFGYGCFGVSFWAKLYKTDLVVKSFSEIQETPEFFGEDLNTLLRIIPNTKKIAVIDNLVYHYRYGGGTNKFMKSFVSDNIFLYKEKKKFAAKYNMSDYCFQLIDVEMKNLAAQYLIMCVRTKTFPHGKLVDEIKYISEIPEYYNAVCAIKKETLENDYSEFTGFVQAFVEKDYATVEKIIVKKANEKKLKNFVKKIL